MFKILKNNHTEFEIDRTYNMPKLKNQKPKNLYYKSGQTVFLELIIELLRFLKGTKQLKE